MLTLLTLALVAASPAPAAATVELNHGHKKLSLDRKSLEALGTTEVTWTERGTAHKVRGVALDKVLVTAGFDKGGMSKEMSPAQKRAGWKKVVRVTATDGFQAIFSCAEVSPDMGSTTAVLALDVDGKPIGDDVGPFRLVVPTDKEPSRSVRNVKRIEILDLASSP